MAAPLTNMLKKNGFMWNEEALEAFSKIKQAVTSPSVLALPEFTKSFVIECDTSSSSIGAVLMQEGKPLAYFSKALKGRMLSMSTFEREILALVSAIRKWRPYLLGQTFKVKIDQQCLKHLLEQKVGTLLQQKWVTKLLGYDFLGKYKHGRDNKVADALSRKFEEGTAEKNGELQAISFSVATWIDDLRVANSTDNQIQDVLSQLEAGKLNPLKYIVSKGLLFYKGWIYVGIIQLSRSRFFRCTMTVQWEDMQVMTKPISKLR